MPTLCSNLQVQFIEPLSTVACLSLLHGLAYAADLGDKRMQTYDTWGKQNGSPQEPFRDTQHFSKSVSALNAGWVLSAHHHKKSKSLSVRSVSSHQSRLLAHTQSEQAFASRGP